MAAEIAITDGHMHFYSQAVYRAEEERLARADQSYREGHAVWKEGFKTRFNSSFAEDPGDDTEALAAAWEKLMAEAGVSRGCFLAVNPDSDDLTEFTARRPDKFFAIATADPRDPECAIKFRRRVKDEGYRGLKLYPTTGKYLLSDPMVYPLYEEAQSLGVPVTAHLGITLSYDADLAYANPIQIHAPGRDFPKLQFIIPHFAAGYLRELLFLAYHLPNINVDTSGTNRWLDYTPDSFGLDWVFKKALFAFGPERIIFGSDSRMLSQGYRTAILREQLGILDSLNLGDTEKTLILSGNARRLFRLP
ncbi:amidohydrolase family protein [Breznakiella homolactica]|uniref:Amidohydrolase family protein n=1 Tax=Breznakiella homolactica TaxID=2798577 RepID=A0A7T7XPU3_9SPIR|nr:amidohydrolase family protein [Breznakiella homolactica]QQO10183.1 amidohydrolase family protein [Breznakiella homolactica]